MIANLLALALSAATLLGSSTPSSPASFRVRPDVLSLSGDGTAFLGGHGWRTHGPRVVSFGRIHWSSFGGARADGQGLMWLNNCTPSCAGGRFQHYPATIQASSIQNGHYTRLTVRFTVGKHASRDSYELLTAGSNSYWQLHA